MDLPEHTAYEVGGCPELGIPNCLSCSLIRCRYEMGPGAARRLTDMARLGRLIQTGKTVNEAGVELGFTRRTTLRLAQDLRGEGR